MTKHKIMNFFSNHTNQRELYTQHSKSLRISLYIDNRSPITIKKLQVRLGLHLSVTRVGNRLHKAHYIVLKCHLAFFKRNLSLCIYLLVQCWLTDNTEDIFRQCTNYISLYYGNNAKRDIKFYYC